MISFRRKRLLVAGFAGLALAVSTFAYVVPKAQAAACVDKGYGSATTTVNIPATGTYKVWSRIQPSSADVNHNSYQLEIEGNTCFAVGGGSTTAIPAGQWTWVSYYGGNTAQTVTHNFTTTGNKTIKLIGNEPNVKLDRVIFTQDTSCVPTGTGDNCAQPPDTTPPTVSVTAPVAGDTVNGTVSLTATAADADSGIQKVGFYYNNTLISEDTTLPYSVNWNTSALPNGPYTIKARATNGQGATADSSSIAVTLNNPTQADLVISSVSASPANPTTGQNVTFSAVIKNQGGTATPAGTIHGVVFKVGTTVVGWSDNSTASLAPGATRTVTANGGPGGVFTWAAVAGTHTITAQVDDVNRITEGNESNNTSTINLTVGSAPVADTTKPTVNLTAPDNDATIGNTVKLTATASDNVGVSRVEFYVNGDLIGGPDGTVPYEVNFDTRTVDDGTYTITAKAFDQAGNEQTSSGRSVTVQNMAAKPEDLNQDGAVNLIDFSLLASKFGQTGPNLGRADINGDGSVGLLDFSLLAGQYGS